MQKFETKNIKHKASLIFIILILALRLFSLSESIRSNAQMKLIGTIINDSYLYYDTTDDIIVTSIFFIVIVFSIIRLKRWKPKYIFINDEGLKFITTKKDEIVIPFSDLKSIRFYSSKIITSKESFNFPILDIRNLSNFLLHLKSNLSDHFSAKQMKKIDHQIFLDNYYQFCKKAIIPQILFLLLFFFIIYHKMITDLSIGTFTVFFSGILIGAFIEIYRYVDFSTKHNRGLRVKQSIKRNWSIYGFGFLFWIIIISIAVLVFK